MKYSRYLEIQKITNQLTNLFLMEEKIEPQDFNSKDFYDYFTSKKHIKTIAFPFSSKKMVAVLQKDNIGTSIMYNSTNSRETIESGVQHELGHAVLHLNQNKSQSFHDGFENLYGDQLETVEAEANTASLVFRIPDITILSLVDSNNISYSMIQRMLEVPDHLLERRLVRYLQINCSLNYDEALRIVKSYKSKFRYTNFSVLRDILTVEIFQDKVFQNFQRADFF